MIYEHKNIIQKDRFPKSPYKRMMKKIDKRGRKKIKKKIRNIKKSKYKERSGCRIRTVINNARRTIMLGGQNNGSFI